MVPVPMTRAVEPSDTSVSSMNVPGALRVSVALPTTTCVGIMVTVTAWADVEVEFSGAGVVAVWTQLLKV